jgi:fucose permease
VLVLSLTSFFTLGVVLVLLGVNQAEMARDLSLDLAASGLLGAALALGLGVGVTCAGPLVDRLPGKRLFVGACLLTSVALWTVQPSMSYARTLTHVVLIGIGCGGYDTVLNVATFDRFTTRASNALAALHASATAGAALGPLLILWGSAGGHWTRTFHGLAAIYLGFACWGAVSRLPARAVSARTHTSSALASLASPALIALAIIAFAYVGVENSLTMFAVPWAQSQRQAEAIGRSGISALWLGLFFGRLALALQRRPPGAAWLVACGLAGTAVVCSASVFSLGSLTWVLGAAGLALGPVYPLMISLAARRFPEAVGTASGLASGAGALGGFSLPWLAGAVGDAIGMRAAIATIGSCSLLIALAALALARGTGEPRSLVDV